MQRCHLLEYAHEKRERECAEGYRRGEPFAKDRRSYYEQRYVEHGNDRAHAESREYVHYPADAAHAAYDHVVRQSEAGHRKSTDGVIRFACKTLFCNGYCRLIGRC